MFLRDIHSKLITGRVRINPHEAKENIHLRPTSISRTLFRFFSFTGTSVSLSKSRDTGTAQKKDLDSPIQRTTILVRPIGAVAPIDVFLYHHAYIGPVLVIPPRLFRGRDPPAFPPARLRMSCPETVSLCPGRPTL